MTANGKLTPSKLRAACSVAMSATTELAASMQLANYPAVIAFGVATHRSQLKARTPLARDAGHSAARSVAKAQGDEHYILSENWEVFN